MSSIPKPPYASAVEIDASRVADSDLSSYTWRMVKATTTGVALCGSGENPYGVLYNAPVSGEYAEVAVNAVDMTGIASGAITAGDCLKPAANGKLATASATDKCCGIAKTTAADGGYVVYSPSRFVMV